MAYSKTHKTKLVNKVCELIEEGHSLRKSLKEVSLPAKTFYTFIDDDEGKRKQYARACEMRAEALVDEMFEIADESHNDTNEIDLGDGIVIEKTNHEAIQRSKLKVDTRKWLVSKLNPKKYGDKIGVDHTTDGDKLPPSVSVVLPDGMDLTDYLKKHGL